MRHHIIYRQFIARFLVSLALAGVLAAPMALAATGDGAADAKLEQQVAALAKAHHGRVTVYAKQWNTGRSVAIDADQPKQTASVLQLTVLVEAMEQIGAGKAHWDEKITLAKGDGVSGSGVLAFFDTPVTLTLKDIVSKVVIMSDNTAPNLAIDRFGVDTLNARV